MADVEEIIAESIRIYGTVQGVGFRPTVWRLARAHSLTGSVWNDADGVGIHVWGTTWQLEGFVRSLRSETPPLARIERIERMQLIDVPMPASFEILSSVNGETHTDVAADAASCSACQGEIMDPANRRFRYPFTNCTHCGPRLSIIRAVPYDRANTSMSRFPLCSVCQAEYQSPVDRRFHAQPNACPVCGPRVWLEDTNGEILETADGEDVIGTAQRLIAAGKIVAVKGIGGIHLACDACNEDTVERLRRCKRRYRKAFALMAKDIAVIQRYAFVDEASRRALRSAAAPIVVLDASGESVAAAVAPGYTTLGFMLPYSPLHHLLLQQWERPIVLTSGNLSDEPQCITNGDARSRLAPIADYLLLHDREIVNRLDDSVVRVMAGKRRLLRRARGYAPAPIALPEGFTASDAILAMGGELKNSFCLLQRGRAILSQYMGDLENAYAYEAYRENLARYRTLFDHNPRSIAVDLHPDYLSTQLGQEIAKAEGIELIGVQHHHAHIAACMAEHGVPLDTKPLLGVAMDGLGYGDDGTLWGGEFLLVDYRSCRRLANFTPVAMPGGARAIIEPWRNAYAHLQQAFGWEWVRAHHHSLEIVQAVEKQPLHNLARMIERGLNSPLASSCGRLFDAVAAVLGLSVDAQLFEGQAAMELEAISAPYFSAQRSNVYPFETVQSEQEGWVIHFRSLWRALLQDLSEGCEAALIGARFHQTLCALITTNAMRLARAENVDRIVLSGGVFQNRLVLEGVSERLNASGLRVLSPASVPANDGGIALGQAVIAAAKVKARALCERKGQV